MKAGDEKDLDITFPEDYHKDLAGKKVVFHVQGPTRSSAKERPKLDDEFAKDVSEYDTLKELKDEHQDARSPSSASSPPSVPSRTS